MQQNETLGPAHINKFLAGIVLYFMGYMAQSGRLELKLSDLKECFPVDLLPEGLSQEQAIINFFKNRGLTVIGSTSLDKASIEGALSPLPLESRIV